MKFKIYTLLITLAMLLPAVTLRSEVITGISDPFTFGSPPPVPLSPWALVFAALLIGFFVYRQYLGKKKKTA